MTIFITEKNLNGILRALYYSFTKKTIPDDVTDGNNYQPKLGARFIKITADGKTDENNVARVADALVKYGGTSVLTSIKVCLLSIDTKVMLLAFNFAYKTLSARKNVYKNLSDPVVSEFVFTEKKVLSGRHLMTGFLKFKDSENKTEFEKLRKKHYKEMNVKARKST